ncbi:MAG: DUF1501 domain-containing protein [Planctomycetales bacterium]|nr:DUF1501 domain-containing protein [Planctomycetales bacterium]
MASPASRRSPAAIPRRELLRVGMLGGALGAGGGISLPQILAARESAGAGARSDRAVILLYLHGGPSHLETYDLKPDAPSSYRSIYAPIATATPGMEICELFPGQAKLSDKLAILRGCHHTMSSHSDGGITVLTGKAPTIADPTSTSKSEHPDFGHVASHLRSSTPMPQYIALPRAPYMTRPTYLGVHCQALDAGDPATESYQSPIRIASGLSEDRLTHRRGLLRDMDSLRRGLDRSQLGVDRFRDLAFNLLSSPRVEEAFDLTKESDATRDAYGRNSWGQSALLARRLAEAGAAVITMFMNTPLTGPEWTNWDDHIMNAGRPGHFGQYMSRRLPYLDQCLSALIEDIYRRGIDRQVLVVVMGEFGRTPRLSENANGVGRDHWPQAYSVLMSGGGLRTGQVIGATNGKGEYPTQRPTTPDDVLATIYRHLDIPPRTEFVHNGRPVRLLDRGEPIQELL